MPADPHDAIRVLIADDHAVVREGIRQVLSAEVGFDVVGEAADGAEAVALASALRPDVIVLDLSLPVLSGLEAAARICADVPETNILVLSIHDHEEYVLQSVRAGAHGYLRKDSSPMELRNAVRIVHTGQSFFSPEVVRSLSSALHNERAREERRARIAGLTQRERHVLIEIARGRTNKEVAHRLGISVRTVESHRETLMRKLACAVSRVSRASRSTRAWSSRRKQPARFRAPPNNRDTVVAAILVGRCAPRSRASFLYSSLFEER